MLKGGGQLEGALQNLLTLEKTARLSGDVGGTTELVTSMVELCYEAKDLPKLSETISLLAKRRAQLKQAVTAMVQQASKYVDELSTEEKLPLIETLRAVSEGKMFVEVERARLTRILAGIHEAKGNLTEARGIMIDTVVETLGGMDKREKTDYILEQVRLCLDTEDYVRAQIMAKKINTKVFKDPELDDLKLRFYTMIVQYHAHSHNWMEIFRAYQAQWDSPSLQADEEATDRCLKRQVLYLLLSPYDNEQSDQMHTISKEVKLERPSLAQFKQLLKFFVTKEVFHFADLRSGVDGELVALGGFTETERTLMLDTLADRVTQHNIQVASMYYEEIQMERLAQLIQLPVTKMEEQLCSMVSKKQLYARVDRPAGIVNFAPPKAPNDLLNDWSSDISEMLTLLESTCHLIHKENMIHKIV
jgi:26S proteasome regulatory subunit N5